MKRKKIKCSYRIHYLFLLMRGIGGECILITRLTWKHDHKNKNLKLKEGLQISLNFDTPNIRQ